MLLTGEMLIAGQAVRGSERSLRGLDPSTGQELDPPFPGGTKADMERECAQAWEAFDPYRETGLEQRANFLEAIAEQILAVGDPLIERTRAESGLPRGRIERERGRTVGQLRLFAALVRAGSG